MQLTPPRWVIAELDVNGEIDEHAAMCLRYGFEDALAILPSTILVDLRELTEIAAAGLALFVGQDADCRARDTQLAILVCADARQQRIVRAFTDAGLGDRLQFSYAPGPAEPVTRPARAPRATARWYRRPASTHP
jgi:anti-anti-sigma factor